MVDDTERSVELTDEEKDESVMYINAEPGFTDNKELIEDLEIGLLAKFKIAENNYLIGEIDLDIAKEEHKAEIDRQQLAIKDTFKELGLTNQSLRDSHCRLEAFPKLEKVHAARKKLAQLKVEYDDITRQEKHQRMELLVKLLADKKDFLTLMELIR